MLKKFAFIPLALTASTTLAEGVWLWETIEANVAWELDDFFELRLGKSDSTEHGGIAVNALFLDESQKPLGFTTEVQWLDHHKLHPNWDGVLIVEANRCTDGKYDKDSYTETNRIAHIKAVDLCGQVFDLTQLSDFDAFNRYASENRVKIVQLPLLISDGELDVREVEGAPESIHRFAYTGPYGSMGIYQTTEPMTLYHASKQFHATTGDREPQMAVSLPMGDQDFCMMWENPTVSVSSCGKNDPDFLPALILSSAQYPM